MKVIVPANNKGGVGKTSLSSILGDYFAKVCKKKTLLIDLDSQCNLSQRYLRMEMDPSYPEGHIPPIHPDYANEEDWDGRSSIADIFLRPDNGIVPYPTMSDYLDIAPAHAAELLSLEQIQKEQFKPLIVNRFQQFLNLPDVQNEYEVVVIDTPPSKGWLTRSAIRAATDLIIPSLMEDKSLKGVYGIIQLWMSENQIRDVNQKIQLIGILANMVDHSTTLHTGYYESLKENQSFADYIIPHKLSRRIAFAEIDSDDAAPKSVFDFPVSNKAHAEALQACEFIAERIFA